MNAAPESPESTLTDAYIDQFSAEVAHELESANVGEVTRFLESLSPARACSVIEHLSEQRAADCLLELDDKALARIAALLDPSKAAILMSRLDAEARERRLAVLDAGVAAELRELISFPANSAGHVMDTRVHSFRPTTQVKDIINRLRQTGDAGVHDVLMVDRAGKLLGLVTLSELALADPRQRLEHLVKSPPPQVQAMAPREDVVALFEVGHFDALPVVDGQDRLLGVIHHDAIVQAVKEEATADLATLVGVSKDEQALSPAMFAVRKRLPWLNINLVTAFLAAAVVGLFEDTIAKFTALAVLLPVVAGQSGNTGAQSLAVVIRGLALREIRASHWPPVVLKEALVGVVNGIAIAVVTAVGVYVWSQSVGLCLVIFLAMILSMVIAGVSGASIPMILASLRQDPAQSGSIILTTVTDVMGFFSFLGLATLFSSML
ncbi:MAG: magnesium transporter [Gammaproteobacteria bacterium]|nr:magnesium transporter [Gammaproteobacteria bacterium]